MTPERAVLEHLVWVATLAPAGTCTPPWRLHRTREGLFLLPDGSSPGVLDLDPRRLAVWCGAALDHLVVAARGAGLDASLALVPESHPYALAEVALVRGAPPSAQETALAVAAVVPTGAWALPAADLPVPVLDRLLCVAAEHGVAVRALTGERVLLTTEDQGVTGDLRLGMALSRVHLEARAAGLAPVLVDSELARAGCVVLRLAPVGARPVAGVTA